MFSVSDALDVIRGRHHFTFGGGIRANQMNVLTNGFGDGYFLMFGGSGSFTGDDAADLLLGQVGGSHSRPDVPGRHDRTPLEDVFVRLWRTTGALPII